MSPYSFMFFFTHNAIKVPQWFAVQEGDATMFIQGPDAWTKK